MMTKSVKYLKFEENKQNFMFSSDDKHFDGYYMHYQLNIQNFINPYSKQNNLFLYWQTGAGKSLGVIGIAEKYREYIEQSLDNNNVLNARIYIIADHSAKMSFYRELYKLDRYKSAGDKMHMKKEIRKFYTFFGPIKYYNLLTGVTQNTKLYYALDPANSLFIFDEIHEFENNTSGELVLKLKEFEDQRNKYLFLSATPINTYPSEFVHILNFLMHKSSRLKVEDYFDDVNAGRSDTFKHKDVPMQLAEKSKGYFSVIKPPTRDNYPTEYDKGVIKCIMSSYQAKIYKKYSKENIQQNNEIIYINDLVLPEGLFTKNDILSIKERRDYFKRKYHLEVTDDGKLFGNFFSIDNLKTYSTKLHKMARLVLEEMKRGKIFIYHGLIDHGVFLISTTLDNIGFIEYGAVPHKTTLCSKCFKPFSSHHASGGCEFMPLSYLRYYGNVSETGREKYLNIFNDDNIYGHKVMVIIGSIISKRSIEFKEVRTLIMMFPAVNIPMQMQITGRGSRLNSHAMLPKKERDINFYFLAASPSKTLKGKEEIVYEKLRNRFSKAQEILNKVEEFAINCTLNQQKNCKIIPIKNLKDDEYMRFSYLIEIDYVREALNYIFMHNNFISIKTIRTTLYSYNKNLSDKVINYCIHDFVNTGKLKFVDNKFFKPIDTSITTTMHRYSLKLLKLDTDLSSENKTLAEKYTKDKIDAEIFFYSMHKSIRERLKLADKFIKTKIDERPMHNVYGIRDDDGKFKIIDNRIMHRDMREYKKGIECQFLNKSILSELFPDIEEKVFNDKTKEELCYFIHYYLIEKDKKSKDISYIS